MNICAIIERECKEDCPSARKSRNQNGDCPALYLLEEIKKNKNFEDEFDL